MEDAPQTEVAVVIVSYGRPGDVLTCLAALRESEFAGFEVAIVENAGPLAVDQLCAVLAKAFPALRRSPTQQASLFDASLARVVVKTDSCYLAGGQLVTVFAAVDNLGFAGGVNAAIKTIAADAKWHGVWILNPDTIPTPKALAAVKLHAEQGYGLVGSRVVFADNSAVQIRGGRWRKLLARGVSVGLGDAPNKSVDPAAIEQEIEWVSGVAAYATRDFVETVGLMTEAYFLYCEDVDWSLRGRRNFRLGYAHDSIVFHAYGTTIGSARALGERSTLSVYLTERNKLLLTAMLFPWLFPLVALLALPLTGEYWLRGNVKLFITALRGWWAGIRNETGAPNL